MATYVRADAPPWPDQPDRPDRADPLSSQPALPGVRDQFRLGKEEAGFALGVLRVSVLPAGLFIGGWLWGYLTFVRTAQVGIEANAG